MNTFWNKQCLDGKWQLFIASNFDYNNSGKEYSALEELENSGFEKIGGTVPGNFELDLQREGIIGDLFVGMNPLKTRELENRHLWYVKYFTAEIDDGEDWYFQFEGIDTFSEIYLNGNLIAITDNMLIPYEVKAKGLMNGENELVVHIIPVFIKARENVFESGIMHHQYYNAESVTVRKAPHMFGWDIMPRALSGGIWRSVYLFKKPSDRIDDVFISTLRLDEKSALLNCYYRTHISEDSISDYKIVVTGTCSDSAFMQEHCMWHTEERIVITVNDPKLWWPKGMGEPSLYNVTVELVRGDTVLDKRELSVGIRTAELDCTDIIEEDGSGEFCFVINGEKMFVRGTNWVPLDPFHSRDLERLPKALELLDESNCNMVRCWGGNVYESDEFFDFCDKKGIAVWQDFAMACSYYPQTDHFAKVIENEAEHIIRRLRNHAALIVWAGDNECDFFMSDLSDIRYDPNKNILTRKVLPEAIRRMDPFRAYLPSSPYISQRAFDSGNSDNIPENHLWGPRCYFKTDFYMNSACRFVSETGYHACPSPDSLKKFLTDDRLWHWKNNPEWELHATSIETGGQAPYAYRVGVMDNQINCLFGVHPDNIEDFALMSQMTQAEANKFLIEHFRLGKWERTTGILWWNLIDGWPQFSDSAVDYYYNRKLAYSVMQRIQEPVCLMMREPENGYLTLACANDTLEGHSFKYRVTDITNDRVIAEGEAEVHKNVTEDIAKVPYTTDETVFYLIEWDMDGKTYKNHYVGGKAPISFEKTLEGYKKCEMLKLEGF